jgi:hypothetical protein
MATPTVGPAPKFPERPGNTYDRKFSAALPGQRGPLRFEEGVATDTDVPEEFRNGAMQGYTPAPGRPNRNAPVHTKPAEETMHERAHVGSASWVEAPTYLQEYASGSFADYAENKFERSFRDGTRQQRMSPAVVQD